MIRFSFSSFYMSLFFANMMILILYLIFRNTKLMIKLGLPMLGAVVFVTILRMMLPFEFLFLTHNIYFPKTISMLIGWFISPRFIDERFSIWSIVELFWLCGIILSGIRFVKSEYSFAQNVKQISCRPSDSSAVCQILRRIQEEYPKTQHIQILIMPDILTPSIYGIRKTYILLPEGLSLDEEKLYYAIKHEISHYLHHDLYTKLGLQILSVIYWWNPLFKFLILKTDTIMEMRVDQKVASHLNQRTDYLNCLISVANYMADYKSASEPANTVSLCGPPNSAFKNRYNMLLPNEIRPFSKRIIHILQLLLVIVFILSFVFIFEASYNGIQESNNTIVPDTNNCYFIEKENGKYDFYMDEEYIGEIDSPEYFSEKIPIY